MRRKKLQWNTNFAAALVQNFNVKIGGVRDRCECTDPTCANAAHKEALKCEFLAKVYANDVHLYTSPSIGAIQTFWCDGVKNFQRSPAEQRKHDLMVENILTELNYKSMDITMLRKMYQGLDQSAHDIVNGSEDDRAHVVSTLVSKLRLNKYPQ